MSLPSETGRHSGAAVARSSAITIGAQLIKQVLMLAASVVMARVLTPEDFGLVAMVSVFVMYLETFRDAGLSTSTVQSPTLSQPILSTLFWMNVLLGTALLAVLVIAAPWIAHFYGHPEVTGIAYALGAGFFIASLVIQHYALLKRDMRFGDIAIIEIVSTALSSGAGIVCALSGMRYWSIVIMTLVNRTCNVLGAWSMSRWMPSFTLRIRESLPMLRLGAGVMIHTTITYAARSLDAILLGRMAGPLTLGLYNRGWGVAVIPLSVIDSPSQSVLLSALSRLQGDPVRFRRAFLTICFIMSGLMTACALVLVVAPHLVLGTLFGGQWLEAAGFLRVLAALTIALPLHNTVNLLYASLGHGSRLAQWGAGYAILTAAALWTGMVTWGPMGLAIAYAASSSLLLLINVHLACRRTVVSAAPVLGAMMLPCALGIVSAATAAALVRYVPLWSNTCMTGREATLAFLAGAIYAAAMAVCLKRPPSWLPPITLTLAQILDRRS